MHCNEGESIFHTLSFLGDNMREIDYQKELIHKIQILFPGCFILRNDPAESQGIPDILILFKDKWAMLEIKTSIASHMQPNQEHYIDLFAEMSFAAFIFPENENEVLHDLQSAFGANW